ncbi:telomerase reverse transcriptase-like, partial [Syngnathus typhle]|uniref:telomerase reverse transcriptase-like n=1 Tax=Syngnathus typhle TaxID=161592 RepID=UPI002A69E21E
FASQTGMSLRHSLTLGIVPSAQDQMRMKLMQILRLKCHPVFLDLKTNLVAAVYKNIYELVFLQALRFHVFARSLPFGQRVAKIPFNFGKRSLERRLGDLQLARVRQAANPSRTVHDLAIMTDETLNACMKLNLTTYQPDYKAAKKVPGP